jgi:hypothetical protein
MISFEHPFSKYEIYDYKNACSLFLATDSVPMFKDFLYEQLVIY